MSLYILAGIAFFLFEWKSLACKDQSDLPPKTRIQPTWVDFACSLFWAPIFIGAWPFLVILYLLKAITGNSGGN